MKILLVVNSFPTLSETFIINKALGLIKNGDKVTVLVHDKSKLNSIRSHKNLKSIEIINSSLLSPYIALLKRLDIIFKALFFYFYEKIPIINSVKNMLMTSDVNDKKYDIIHFEFSGIAIQYIEIIKNINSKVFVSCRGAAELITPLVDKNRGEKLEKLFNIVDRVHCVSKHMAEKMSVYGLKKTKFFVNHPSVELKDIGLIKKSSDFDEIINIVSVSRLHWKKGLIFSSLAICNLLQKGYKIKYTIIGGGIEYESLRFLINEKGIEGDIELIGPRSNSYVKDFFSEC